jgi:hypothetical protein
MNGPSLFEEAIRLIMGLRSGLMMVEDNNSIA